MPRAAPASGTRLAAITAAANAAAAARKPLSAAGRAMPFDGIRSLSVAPDGHTLYAALGTGLGADNQPGAVMAIDVDLTRDVDARTAGIQVDGSRYFTIGKAPLGFPDYLDMIEVDPDESPGPNPYLPSTLGDEPSDVAVDFESANVYLPHGGLDVARGLIPDSSPTSGLYDSILVSGLIGSAGGTGGLTGLLATANPVRHFVRLRARARASRAGELLHSGMTTMPHRATRACSRRARRPTGSQTWLFPSVLNFGWAPPAGRSNISQISNSERFVSRPARLVIDRLDPDGFGLFAYRLTGNFGVLSRPTQALFGTHPALTQPKDPAQGPDAPSPQLFHGLVAVTRSIELDNHAWPDGGRFPRGGIWAARTPTCRARRSRRSTRTISRSPRAAASRSRRTRDPARSRAR